MVVRRGECDGAGGKAGRGLGGPARRGSGSCLLERERHGGVGPLRSRAPGGGRAPRGSSTIRASSRCTRRRRAGEAKAYAVDPNSGWVKRTRVPSSSSAPASRASSSASASSRSTTDRLGVDRAATARTSSRAPSGSSSSAPGHEVREARRQDERLAGGEARRGGTVRPLEGVERVAARELETCRRAGRGSARPSRVRRRRPISVSPSGSTVTLARRSGGKARSSCSGSAAPCSSRPEGEGAPPAPTRGAAGGTRALLRTARRAMEVVHRDEHAALARQGEHARCARRARAPVDRSTGPGPREAAHPRARVAAGGEAPGGRRRAPGRTDRPGRRRRGPPPPRRPESEGRRSHAPRRGRPPRARARSCRCPALLRERAPKAPRSSRTTKPSMLSSSCLRPMISGRAIVAM